MATKLFVSYSPNDLDVWQLILQRLQPYIDAGVIEVWYDHKISPGTDWNLEITSRLLSSDLILLLITHDFLNSDYIRSKEIPLAVNQHNRKRSIVLPAPLDRVESKDLAEIAGIQFVGGHGEPYSSTDEKEEWIQKLIITIISAAFRKKEKYDVAQTQFDLNFVIYTSMNIAFIYISTYIILEPLSRPTIKTAGLTIPFFMRVLSYRELSKNLLHNFINGLIAGALAGAMSTFLLIVVNRPNTTTTAFAILQQQMLATFAFIALCGISTTAGALASETYLGTLAFKDVLRNRDFRALVACALVVYAFLVVTDIWPKGQ